MAESIKVLIAIDSSEYADFAFQYYMKYIHRMENEVILLHVSELPANSIRHMSGTMWEEQVQREKDQTMILEKDYKEKLQKHGLSAKIMASFGNKPGELICTTAEDEATQMIVLGSRGSGKMRRTIMGSVSDYVLHHAHCPVVVCRQEARHHHRHSILDRFRRSSGDKSRRHSESEREAKTSDNEKQRHHSGSSRQKKNSESEKSRHNSSDSGDMTK